MALALRCSGDAAFAAWISVRLALYQLQAGQTSEASNCIATALALQPEYAPALLVHGQALLAEGKNREALTALQRAAQLNSLPEYQWALIEALRLADRLNEAQTVERQLIERGAAARPVN